MSISKKTTLACALALGLAIPATSMAGDGQDRKDHTTHTTQDRMKTQQSQTLGDRAEREEREELDRMSNDGNVDRPDAWVLTKVKAKFAGSDLVHATDINIDVDNGVATLRGIVGSPEERREAVRLAQETQGVKKVDASGLRLAPESQD